MATYYPRHSQAVQLFSVGVLTVGMVYALYFFYKQFNRSTPRTQSAPQ